MKNNEIYTVFLPVESEKRELDYKLNLARHFCKAGLDVCIGHPAFIRDELKYKKGNFIFLEKGANPDPDYYKLLSDNGVFIYDLSDEGNADPVYDLTYPDEVEALQYMRKIFLWGEAQKRSLEKLAPIDEITQKYLVVGSPGFELSLPKFRAMNQEAAPLDLPDQYVLVNTNFSCFNGFSLEEHKKACPKMSPETLETIVNSYKLEEGLFEIFYEWLKQIISNFPEQVFVIRPHPSEKLEKYSSWFSGFSNVIVTKAGNVNQMLSKAKIVLHKDCTSALQAYLMGVPSISIGGAEMRLKLHQWPLLFSLLPNNVDEVISYLKEMANDDSLSARLLLQCKDKANNALEDSFGGIAHANERLIMEILDDVYSMDNEFMHPEDGRTMLQKIKLFIRKRLPISYKVPPLVSETLGNYSRRHVLEKLDAFEKHDPLSIRIKVKKIHHNTYILRSVQ